MKRQFIVMATLGLLLVLLVSPATADVRVPRFTVTDLGTLPGGHESEAYALNDRGQVVGWADGGTDTEKHYDVMVHNHAVLWNHGKVRDLGLLKGFPFSAGYGINRSGQIVGGWDINYHPGYGGGPADLLQNFVWRNGQMTVFGSETPPFLVYAKSINDSGQVAGTSFLRAGYRAVRWTETTAEVLPVPVGYKETYASALNNKGMVVGTAIREDGHRHAVLWRKGGVVDLGAVPPEAYYCEAFGVNDLGQVVGFSSGRGFLWRNGKMEELPPLSMDYPDMLAFSINNQGQIVGEADKVSYRHAFLWQNGITHDLNSLIPAEAGWILLEARAINNHGQVVGWGKHGGKKHAFLLTPVAGK